MRTATTVAAALLALTILADTHRHAAASPEQRLAGRKVPLPKGFPDDVPVYPGTTVVSSTTSPGLISVVLTTADKTEQVETFYNEKLPAQGWNIENTLQVEKSTMLQAKKGSRQCHVLIGDNEDKTFISLSVIESK